MCGLAGEIAYRPSVRADADRALPMLQAILHRGPDDVGCWEAEDGSACLLHARLSLVDLGGGKQPMTAVGDNVVIVYNGEIYGFEEARRDLESQGVIFRTRCDTEILLQLYLRFGPEFVRHLEGEFAFVLLDRRNGRAMLARDRFGIKPLFFASRRGLLLFGSEAKAILAHPWMDRQLDLAVLARELQGVFLPQDTLFAGISALEPGTYMLVSRQEITTCRFADLDPQAAGTLDLPFERAVDALEERLADAVKRRFHGDAPVGIYLSGGVDSSVVAALSATGSSVDPAAYSIDFTGTNDSEYAAAGDAARQLSLRGVRAPVDWEALEASFESSIWHAETIAANAHGTAKMLLAQRAAQDVKAVLTGEGADELHGGYAYFQHAGLLAEAAEGRGGDRLLHFTAQYGPRDGVLGMITPRLRKRLAWSHGGGTPYAAMRAYVAGWGARFLTTSDFRRQASEPPERALLDWLTARAPDARTLDDVTLSRFVALQTDLPRYNLGYLGDRVEMAHGLEARLPFLDTRVADLLWRMPADYHLLHGETKRVLRALLARHLPRVAERPKRAFLTPTAASRDVLGGYLAQRWLSMDATRHAGIFRPTAIAGARRLVALRGTRPSTAFCLSAYLTMALSAHLVVDLFSENFSKTMARRSAMSLDDLRARLAGSQPAPLAAA